MLKLLAATMQSISSPELASSIGSDAARVLDDVSNTRAVANGEPSSDQVGPKTELPNAVIPQERIDQSSQMRQGDQRAIVRQILDRSAKEAGHLRGERLRQAKLSFNMGLCLVVASVVIILCGVALMMTGTLSAGIAGTVVGSICNAISIIVFRFNREANDRLDQINADIGVFEAASLAMTLIDEIEDPRSRDRAIAGAVKVLGSATNRRRGLGS